MMGDSVKTKEEKVTELNGLLRRIIMGLQGGSADGNNWGGWTIPPKKAKGSSTENNGTVGNGSGGYYNKKEQTDLFAQLNTYLGGMGLQPIQKSNIDEDLKEGASNVISDWTFPTSSKDSLESKKHDFITQVVADDDDDLNNLGPSAAKLLHLKQCWTPDTVLVHNKDNTDSTKKGAGYPTTVSSSAITRNLALKAPNSTIHFLTWPQQKLAGGIASAQEKIRNHWRPSSSSSSQLDIIDKGDTASILSRSSVSSSSYGSGGGDITEWENEQRKGREGGKYLNSRFGPWTMFMLGILTGALLVLFSLMLLGMNPNEEISTTAPISSSLIAPEIQSNDNYWKSLYLNSTNRITQLEKQLKLYKTTESNNKKIVVEHGAERVSQKEMNNGVEQVREARVLTTASIISKTPKPVGAKIDSPANNNALTQNSDLEAEVRDVREGVSVTKGPELKMTAVTSAEMKFGTGTVKFPKYTTSPENLKKSSTEEYNNFMNLKGSTQIPISSEQEKYEHFLKTTEDPLSNSFIVTSETSIIRNKDSSKNSGKEMKDEPIVPIKMGNPASTVPTPTKDNNYLQAESLINDEWKENDGVSRNVSNSNHNKTTESPTTNPKNGQASTKDNSTIAHSLDSNLAKNDDKLPESSKISPEFNKTVSELNVEKVEENMSDLNNNDIDKETPTTWNDQKKIPEPSAKNTTSGDMEQKTDNGSMENSKNESGGGGGDRKRREGRELEGVDSRNSENADNKYQSDISVTDAPKVMEKAAQKPSKNRPWWQRLFEVVKIHARKLNPFG